MFGNNNNFSWPGNNQGWNNSAPSWNNNSSNFNLYGSNNNSSSNNSSWNPMGNNNSNWNSGNQMNTSTWDFGSNMGGNNMGGNNMGGNNNSNWNQNNFGGWNQNNNNQNQNNQNQMWNSNQNQNQNMGGGGGYNGPRIIFKPVHKATQNGQDNFLYFTIELLPEYRTSNNNSGASVDEIRWFQVYKRMNSNNSMLGGSNNQQQQNSMFGNNNNQMGGNNSSWGFDFNTSNNPFGTNKQNTNSNFGFDSNNMFGTNNNSNNSMFGNNNNSNDIFNFGTNNNSNSMFGNSNNMGNNQFNFGTNNNQNSMFGTNNNQNSMFGNQNSMFGNQNNNMMGTNNDIFNFSNKNSMGGNNMMGNNMMSNNSGFNMMGNNQGFNFGTNNQGFNFGTNNQGFGNNSNMFGSNMFGSNSNNLYGNNNSMWGNNSGNNMFGSNQNPFSMNNSGYGQVFNWGNKAHPEVMSVDTNPYGTDTLFDAIEKKTKLEIEKLKKEGFIKDDLVVSAREIDTKTENDKVEDLFFNKFKNVVNPVTFLKPTNPITSSDSETYDVQEKSEYINDLTNKFLSRNQGITELIIDDEAQEKFDKNTEDLLTTNYEIVDKDVIEKKDSKRFEEFLEKERNKGVRPISSVQKREREEILNQQRQQIQFNDEKDVEDSPGRGIYAPKLSKKNYYTNPPMKLLERMSVPELSSIKDFTIGNAHGKIKWMGETNLVELNLDELIDIRPKLVEVFPKNVKKHDRGKGLNREAIIELYNIFPKGYTAETMNKNPKKMNLLEEILRNNCLKRETTFISYNYDTGIWKFLVHHFSSYGLEEALAMYEEQKKSGKGSELILDLVEKHEKDEMDIEDDEVEEEGEDQEKQIEIDDDDDDEFSEMNISVNPIALVVRDSMFRIDEEDEIMKEKDESFRQVKEKRVTKIDHPKADKFFFKEDEEDVLMEEKEKKENLKEVIDDIERVQISCRKQPVSYYNSIIVNSFLKDRNFSQSSKSFNELLFFGRSFGASFSSCGDKIVVPCKNVTIFELKSVDDNNYDYLGVQFLGFFKIIYKYLQQNRNLSSSSSKFVNFSIKQPMKLLEEIFYYSSNIFKNVSGGVIEKLTLRNETSIYSIFLKLLKWIKTNHPTPKIRILDQRRLIHEWIKEAVDLDISFEINNNQYSDILKVLLYLSGNNLKNACELLININDKRLSSIVGQSSSEKLRGYLKNQILDWKSVPKGEEKVNPLRLKIYQMLSGETCHCFGEWKRNFMVFLVYQKFFDMSKTITDFETLIFDHTITEIAPPYLEYFIKYRKMDKSILPILNLLEHLKKPPVDISYEIIKFFCFENYSLLKSLDPINYSHKWDDYKMPWFIYQILKSAELSNFKSNISSNPDFDFIITKNFSHQLEIIGLYEWSIWVILFLSNSSKLVFVSDEVKEKMIKNILDRNIETNLGLNEREKFLTEVCDIPVGWIYNSKALKCFYEKNYYLQVVFLLKSKEKTSIRLAHYITIKFVAPKMINNQEFQKIHEILSELEKEKIDLIQWEERGKIYKEFIEFKNYSEELIHQEKEKQNKNEIINNIKPFFHKLRRFAVVLEKKKFENIKEEKKYENLNDVYYLYERICIQNISSWITKQLVIFESILKKNGGIEDVDVEFLSQNLNNLDVLNESERLFSISNINVQNI